MIRNSIGTSLRVYRFMSPFNANLDPADGEMISVSASRTLLTVSRNTSCGNGKRRPIRIVHLVLSCHKCRYSANHEGESVGVIGVKKTQ